MGGVLMTKNEATMRVTLYVTNDKALRALEFAARVLDDACESQPWNNDMPKAAKALRYAANHLAIGSEERAAE